nr:hypothetical protein GCM10025699_77010 [Microbacterium flavescens]
MDYTDLNPDGYYYWDIYSWENAADMMTGDVLLVNNEGFQQADLEAQPTFASHPALAAGQVHEWTGAALDYASQAAHDRARRHHPRVEAALAAPSRAIPPDPARSRPSTGRKMLLVPERRASSDHSAWISRA